MSAPIRILYAEDSASDADLTRARFAAEGDAFTLEIAAGGRECLDRLHAGAFDVLLLDQRLPDMEGIDVLRELIRAGIRLPVVFAAGEGDEEVVVAALRLGAVNYVPKRGEYLETLPAVVRAAVAEHVKRHGDGLLAPNTPRRILYLEHEAMDIELTLRHFAKAAPHFSVEVVGTSAEALTRLAKPRAFDLALIDLRMPDMSGVEFVGRANRLGLEMPPFIVITGIGDDAAAIATLRLGAADYVAKRAGYLDRLTYTIDHAIDSDRRSHANLRLAEELAARRRAEEELRLAKSQLERTIDAGQVGLFDWDIRARHVTYSPMWLRQIGFAGGEIGGSPDEWMDRVHPDDREKVARIGNAYFGARTDRYEQAFRFRHKDGSYRNVLLRGTLSRDERGRPSRLLGSHVDITELTMLHDQLLQLQKMESISRLAGGIAHDFNNLLTVILGVTDLAAENLGAEHPARADMLEIRRTAERAAALTQQLVAFSRRQILHPVALDLNAVVTEMGTMLNRILGEHIRLAFRLDPDLGVVKADRAQLSQILLNLAVNARDAMPGGGSLTTETRNVEVDAAFAATHPALTPGSYVMLAVSDSGTGMDEATRARVFEPFFTTKGGEKGSGLGLATVYGVVRQSGGGISVYSEPGHGSVFRIYLPRVNERASVAAVAETGSPPRGDETILLVEDDGALRQVAIRILEAAGYRVIAADGGEEALARAAGHSGTIALMLTDVVLPGMSGLELATRIRASRPDIQILYTSGFTDDLIVRDGVSDDALAFISKPYSIVDLRSKVREVLDASTGASPGR